MATQADYAGLVDKFQSKRASHGGVFTNDKTADDFVSNINRAIDLGVDPSVVSQYIDKAGQIIGTDITYNLRQGQDYNKAIGNAQSGLSNLISNITKDLQLPQQKKNEQNSLEAQRQKELKQREDLRTELLAKVPGIQKELGDQLLNQEQQAFTRLNPMIESRLNSLGLLQSGALPEAQAKAQQALEEARQARLADFGINAKSRLELDLPYNIAETDIGNQRNALSSAFELDRAGITRRFQEQDLGAQLDLQRSLAAQALDEARADRRARSRDAINSALISGGLGGFGAAAGAYGKGA